MDKRGDLLETIIGTMAGLIVIILLIVGFVKLDPFGCMPETQKKNQATSEVNKLEVFLSGLNVNENKIFPLESPKDWWLLSYGSQDSEIPPEYPSSTMICICEKSDYVTNCGGIHFCKKIAKPFLIKGGTVNVYLKIEIKNLNITNQDKSYELII